MKTTNMTKIRVADIPADGMRIAATVSENNAENNWFRLILAEIFPDQIDSANHSHLSIDLFESEDTVNMIGGVYLTLAKKCDRCLENYESKQQIPIHLVLAPFKITKSEHGNLQEDHEIVRDDINFSFYEFGQINFRDLVKEQIILQLPIGSICNDSCKGLCSQCGLNLNKEKCGCPTVNPDSPFSALKELKVH